MRTFLILCLLAVLYGFQAVKTDAAVFNVPGDYSNIQDAVGACSDSDTILVADGTYYGSGNRNIDFGGKEIRLKSENGPWNCIIDCENSGRGFYFHTNESEDAMVEGFTIRRGYLYNQPGTGIYCNGSSPTIANCIIKDNTAGSGQRGGGIYCSNSTAVIAHCMIRSNVAYNGRGAGIYCQDGNITISNTAIWKNSCDYGAGIYCNNSVPQISGCTVSDNTADNYGGGVYCEDASPVIVNSIIYDNFGEEIYETGTSSPDVTYSDVQGGQSGTGNISSDPLFVEGFFGPFYLSETAAGQAADSPCIDSGGGLSSAICYTTSEGTECMGDWTTRTDSIVDLGQVDMGVHMEIPSFPSPTPTPTVMPTFTPGAVILVPSDHSTIQAAVDAASDGDKIIVADGSYYGTGNKNVDFHGKEIVLESENGPEYCVIDCENSGRGFYFHTNEEESSIVRGFTVRRGYQYNQPGMGIYCNNASPTIENCVIRDNTSGTGQYGAGIYCYASDAVISNCSVIRNSCPNGRGGGIGGRYSSPSINECTITGNYSRNGGGLYFYLHTPTLNKCTIHNNTAEYYGAGVYSDVSDLTITNSTLSSNTTFNQTGAGIFSFYSPVYAMNCCFYGNVSPSSGGGMHCDYNDAVIMNCTFHGNSASTGGAIYCDDSSPSIANCIMWENVPNEIQTTVESYPEVVYSDVFDGYAGEGNIDSDPSFVGGIQGVYYLSQVAAGQGENSPCLDSGMNFAAGTCYTVLDHAQCLDELTTRTDHATDAGIADMGFHYDMPVSPTPTVTPSPTPTLEPPTRTPATIIEVPDDFDTIQEAIDAASEGDLVLVEDGTYYGNGNKNLDFNGKELVVASVNGPHYTVIDCENSGRGFIFHTNEDHHSIVRGFTIRRGYLYNQPGMGIYCNNASPVIENCIIRNNTSGTGQYGGGIYCSSSDAVISRCSIIRNSCPNGYGGGIGGRYASPVISDCRITENYSREGGGIYFYFDYPSVNKCTIINNTAEYYGGGISSRVSSLTLTNSTIAENTTYNQSGAGLYGFYTSPLIANCNFYGNSAAGTGGAILCDYIDPLILNCTFTTNSASQAGAVYCIDSSPEISNCILWGNIPNEIVKTGDSYPVVSHCDIEGGYSGTGNIDASPVFYSGMQGTAYLSQTAAGQSYDSPCVNAGSAAASDVCYLTQEGVVCLDELTTRTDHVTDAGTADMGYHYDMPVSPTPTATPSATPTMEFPTWTPAAVIEVPDDFDTIQDAIDASDEGDLILIDDGTYYGTGNKDLDFHGKEIVVSSVNGPHYTVIDCENSGRGFIFHTGEDHHSVVRGFTIRRGYLYNQPGMGIYCNNASPTIENCIIRDNTTGTGQYGGGIYCLSSDAVISGCTIHHNSCPNGYGGGIGGRYSSPDISDCTVTGNYSRQGGGVYLYFGYPTIDDSTIENNTAEYWGAGIYCDVSSLILTNSTLSDNTAYNQSGGGFYGFFTSPVIANCLFTGNSVPGSGGAIYCDYIDPLVMNCTIAGNTAGSGGGIYCEDSSPEVLNSILWGDVPNEVQTTGDSFPTVDYCDVEEGYSGDGNIDENPIFYNGLQGNYYLAQLAAGQLWQSVCVDAGSDAAADTCFLTGKGLRCMDEYTTRTDHVTDGALTDIGFHYGMYRSPTPTATPSATPTQEFPTWTPAAVINVPGDYDRIQDAIDAANDYDLVLVDDGTYYGTGNKDLDFHGKEIVVSSINGPKYCVIDCENSGRVLFSIRMKTVIRSYGDSPSGEDISIISRDWEFTAVMPRRPSKTVS